MSDYLQDIPDWIKTATRPKDVDDWGIVLDQRNFLAGAYVGHAGRIAELEEQLKIAREYQREIDARFTEQTGEQLTNSSATAHLGGMLVAMAKDIRAQEI
jgi:hypothetical protein